MISIDELIFVNSILDKIHKTIKAISYNQLSTYSTLQVPTYEVDNHVDTFFPEVHTVDSVLLTLQYINIKVFNILAFQTIKAQQLRNQSFSSVYYLSNVDLDPLDKGNELFSAAILVDNTIFYTFATLDIISRNHVNYSGLDIHFSKLVEKEEIKINELILIPSNLTLSKQSMLSKDNIKLSAFLFST